VSGFGSRQRHGDGFRIAQLADAIGELRPEQAVGLIDGAVALRADVALAVDCRRLVDAALERFGALHVLVNNAGIWRSGTVEETSEEDWDALMAVNVRGVFLCSKFAVPASAAAGGGSIIQLCSLAGITATAGWSSSAFDTSSARATRRALSFEFCWRLMFHTPRAAIKSAAAMPINPDPARKPGRRRVG